MRFSRTSLISDVQRQLFINTVELHICVAILKNALLVTMLQVDSVTTKGHWWKHDNSFAVLFDPRDKAAIHQALITKYGKRD